MSYHSCTWFSQRRERDPDRDSLETRYSLYIKEEERKWQGKQKKSKWLLPSPVFMLCIITYLEKNILICLLLKKQRMRLNAAKSLVFGGAHFLDTRRIIMRTLCNKTQYGQRGDLDTTNIIEICANSARHTFCFKSFLKPALQVSESIRGNNSPPSRSLQ